MSKRKDIAKIMQGELGFSAEQWLTIIYRFEAKGYQVVKNSETAEYQGLRNA